MNSTLIIMIHMPLFSGRNKKHHGNQIHLIRVVGKTSEYHQKRAFFPDVAPFSSRAMLSPFPFLPKAIPLQYFCLRK